MKTLFTTIPQLCRILSGESVMLRLKLLLQFYYFFLTRKLLSVSSDLKFPFTFNGQNISMYLRYPMDIAVLCEVFINKEYEWVGSTQPEIIIDLGAHFGDTSLYYHARFPNAKIIAVEPSPENYARLVNNTKNIKNIICVQAAVGGSNGTMDLHLVDSSLGHSLLNRAGSTGSVTVDVITFDNLCNKVGIEKADLVKFDIEGAEFDLFKNIDTTKFASTYVGEVHFDLDDTTQESFTSYFKNFKITYIPIKAERFLFRAE